MSTTVEHEEIKRFTKKSGQWWDENGTYASLHKINPVRIDYIRKSCERHFRADDFAKAPLKGLKILDIGCGGGLVCEPLARLGAEITGIDADPGAIGIAKKHAQKSGLDIKYINSSAEDLPKKRDGSYDVVLALEIIEHVSDLQLFIDNTERLCRKGGLVIFSTINRTAKSYAFAVVAAERILGWVPKGTHNWNKFIRPDELAKAGRKSGLRLKEIKGVTFNPFRNEFELSTNSDINYFALMERPKGLV